MNLKMQHRHITANHLTLTAIDDIIERGKRVDWHDLRLALEENHALAPLVLKVCERRCTDPYNQRYFGWRDYVRSRIA